MVQNLLNVPTKIRSYGYQNIKCLQNKTQNDYENDINNTVTTCALKQ